MVKVGGFCQEVEKDRDRDREETRELGAAWVLGDGGSLREELSGDCGQGLGAISGLG